MSHISVVIPMYRNGEHAAQLIRALQDQELPATVTLDIIVVDDGSGDGTPDRLEQSMGQHITLKRLPTNSGRSAARNHGAALATGDMLLFMDCDCLPEDNQFIAEHWSTWSPGTVATTGPVRGTGDGFWDRYQQRSSARRARQHAMGMVYSGASNNMMVDRRTFDACQGFDLGYMAYGFEDRDLLIRLGRTGRIGWAQHALIRHVETLTLARVVGKVREAGQHTSTRFATRHRAAYETLGYASLDARIHRWLEYPANWLAPVLPVLARIGDRLTRTPLLPYAIKAAYVKLVVALGYAVGTAQAQHDLRHQ